MTGTDQVLLTILYEDARGAITNFGPHKLLIACVRDLLNGDYHVVAKRVRDHQANGDSKLLAKCRFADSISMDGHPVVAVFDNDKIRNLLGLPRDAPDNLVRQVILKDVSSTVPVTVVLLKQNTESLLDAAAHCHGSLPPKDLQLAIKKKNLNARDAIFSILAKSDSAVRACILDANPSFGELVEIVCNMVRPHAASLTTAHQLPY